MGFCHVAPVFGDRSPVHQADLPRCIRASKMRHLTIEEVDMKPIAANEFRHSATMDARMLDATRLSVGFGVVCLWSVVGLILTVLVAALGLGNEIGQSLTMAG
jgi:hypothetical protein